MPASPQNHLNLAASLCIVAFGWVPQISVMITAGSGNEAPAWPLPLHFVFLSLATSISGLIFAAVFAKRESFAQAGVYTLIALFGQSALCLLAIDSLATSYGPGQILLVCRLFQVSSLIATFGVVAILITLIRGSWTQIRSDRKVALFVLPVSLFAGGVVVVASESTITEVHGCTVLSTGTEEHDYLRNRRGTYEVQAVSTSCGDFVVNGDLTTGRFWDDLVWAQLETGRTYDFTLSGLGLQRLNIVELREIASPQ